MNTCFVASKFETKRLNFSHFLFRMRIDLNRFRVFSLLHIALLVILLFLYTTRSKMIDISNRYPSFKNVKNLNTDTDIKNGDIVMLQSNNPRYPTIYHQDFNITIKSAYFYVNQTECYRRGDTVVWRSPHEYSNVTIFPFKVGNYTVSTDLIRHSFYKQIYKPTGHETLVIKHVTEHEHIGNSWFYKGHGYDISSYMRKSVFSGHYGTYNHAFIQVNDPFINIAVNLILLIINSIGNSDSVTELDKLFEQCTHGDSRFQINVLNPPSLSILAQIQDNRLVPIIKNKHVYGHIIPGIVSTSYLVRPESSLPNIPFAIITIISCIYVSHFLSDSTKQFNANLVFFALLIYAFRSFYLNYQVLNRNVAGFAFIAYCFIYYNL